MDASLTALNKRKRRLLLRKHINLCTLETELLSIFFCLIIPNILEISVTCHLTQYYLRSNQFNKTLSPTQKTPANFFQCRFLSHTNLKYILETSVTKIVIYYFFLFLRILKQGPNKTDQLTWYNSNPKLRFRKFLGDVIGIDACEAAFPEHQTVEEF